MVPVQPPTIINLGEDSSDEEVSPTAPGVGPSMTGGPSPRASLFLGSLDSFLKEARRSSEV